MKPLKAILFMFLLLFGTLLGATSNNKFVIKPKTTKQDTIKTASEKDLEFVPGTVLL